MLPFELAHVDFEHSDKVDNPGIALAKEPPHPCYRYTIATRTPPRPVRIHGILLDAILSKPSVAEHEGTDKSCDLITWITSQEDAIDQICEVPGTPIGNARDSHGVVHRLERIDDSARLALIEAVLDSEDTTIWLAAPQFNPNNRSLFYLTPHNSAEAALCDPNPLRGIELMTPALQVWTYPRGDFVHLTAN